MKYIEIQLLDQKGGKRQILHIYHLDNKNSIIHSRISGENKYQLEFIENVHRYEV